FIAAIKKREVLPEDLVLRVAVDQLGSGVPADDGPSGIEHDDGVVFGALDELAEAFLALEQREIVHRAVYFLNVHSAVPDPKDVRLPARANTLDRNGPDQHRRRNAIDISIDQRPH